MNFNNLVKYMKQIEETGLQMVISGTKYIKKEILPTFKAFVQRISSRTYDVCASEVAKVKKVFGEHVHFKFSHFVGTTATAALVFALTFTLTGFNRAKVNTEVLAKTETSTTYNDKEIKVNYGDDSAILDVAKEIVAKDNESVYGVKALSVDKTSSTYEIGNYIVDINKPAAKQLTDTTVEMIVSPKETAQEVKAVTVEADDEIKKNEATVAHTYTLDVEYVDTQAPNILLSSKHADILDTATFDAKSYVKNVNDNYDETVNYTVEGTIPTNDEGLYVDGDYTYTFTAVDTKGNKKQETLTVSVKTDEEAAQAKADAEAEAQAEAQRQEQAANPVATGNSYAQDVPAGAYGNAIASAALAQLGVSQDCTMLVTNALAAVGIYHHGWPASYMSLGTIVSNPQPGDLIYYDNAGAGVPHIAVYIGGGQAVHGGFNGGTTAIATAYLGSGPVFIRVG